MALTRAQITSLVAVGILFAGIRLGGIATNPQLEDHDSISYLSYAKIILSADASRIWNLSPDATPAYPAAIALASFVFGDLEFSARLVSFFASLAIAGCLFLLAKRFANAWCGIIAVALFAVNPTLVRFSYSVISEPLYTALAFCGFTIFLHSYKKPNAKQGALLGLLFGLSFLTRLEGILFLAAIPLLFWLYWLLTECRPSWKILVPPIALFAVVFTLLSAPQVIRVSDSMNTFSLNGRTIWSVILNTPDDKSYAEKIYGLDYDPGTTNLTYLQKHPEAMAKLKTTEGSHELILAYIVTFIRNLEDLHNVVLTNFFGLPAIALCFFGMFWLCSRHDYSDAINLILFSAIGIVAPLLHNVDPRHIMIVSPPFILFASIGIIGASLSLSGSQKAPNMKSVFWAAVLVAVTCSPYLPDLGRIFFRPDRQNNEYDEYSVQSAVHALKVTTLDSNRPQRVLARKTYFGYFANMQTVSIPYTNLRGLENFARLNDVDFVFLETRLLERETYPFLDELRNGHESASLQLIHTGKDANGGELFLYRFDASRIDNVIKDKSANDSQHLE